MRYLLAIFLLALTAHSAEVTIGWDHDGVGVSRYHVFWRQWNEPGQGVFPQSTRNVPEKQILLTDIPYNVPYLYEVAAADSDGNQSEPAMLIHTITNDIPQVVQKPTNLRVVNLMPTTNFMMRANIAWTNGESIHMIRSKSPSGGNWNTNVVTNSASSASVENLLPMRNYDIRVTGVDAAGNESIPVELRMRTNRLTTPTAVIYSTQVVPPLPPLPPQ